VRATARHGLTRSVSIGPKSSFNPGVGNEVGDRRSTGSGESGQSERPHTLVEK
jgi:hypothetical protein